MRRAAVRRLAQTGAASALLLVAVTAAVLSVALPTAFAKPRPPKEKYFRATFPKNAPLVALPGAAILNPKQQVNAIAITLAPTVVEVRARAAAAPR